MHLYVDMYIVTILIKRLYANLGAGLDDPLLLSAHLLFGFIDHFVGNFLFLFPVFFCGFFLKF